MGAVPSDTGQSGWPYTWEEAIAWIRSRSEFQQLVLDAYYDDPLLSAATRYWRSEEWAAIRNILPRERGRALDVGAGRGIASYALAKEGFQVVALEPNSSAVVGAQAIRNLAAECDLSIDVVQEPSERLPFGEKAFDIVFARAVLHHTSDMAAACREFFRVLKPGGLLVAVREHVISRASDLAAFFQIHPLHQFYGGENAFLLKQYVGAIRAAGFGLQQVLAPFDTPINYAPHTLQGLQSEVAQRIGGRIPGAQSVLNHALRLPGVWPVVRELLQRVDRRPGRLYSFIARRP